MMSWTTEELVRAATVWLWPFLRIGAMFAAAPILGASYVPTRIRLGLAIALTLVLVPVIPTPPAVVVFSGESFVIALQQIVIGVAMGLALRLAFTAFELAGQIIAQHMALHFASLVDPNSGVQVPMISQFYILLTTLVFLALDGHLMCIQVLAESFSAIPVGAGGLGRHGFWDLALQGGWIFSSAVLFAIPIVAALLVVNLAFGVMTRAAPQLNIFAVGFPVALILGFAVMLLTLPGVMDHLEQHFTEIIGFVRHLAGGEA